MKPWDKIQAEWDVVNRNEVEPYLGSPHGTVQDATSRAAYEILMEEREDDRGLKDIFMDF